MLRFERQHFFLYMNRFYWVDLLIRGKINVPKNYSLISLKHPHVFWKCNRGTVIHTLLEYSYHTLLFSASHVDGTRQARYLDNNNPLPVKPTLKLHGGKLYTVLWWGNNYGITKDTKYGMNREVTYLYVLQNFPYVVKLNSVKGELRIEA